jgi:UDP-glucose:(heptosyl)LPS alpha-1,3-glucosyltransferase
MHTPALLGVGVLHQTSHDQRLSIAVVIRHFTTTGGAEKYAVEITKRMVARGHRVHVVAREIDAGIAQGMQQHFIPKGVSLSSAFHLYRFGKAVSKRIGQHAFDVIHAHEKGVACDVSTVHTFSYIHGFDQFSWLKKLNTLYLSPRGRLYFRLEKKQLDSLAVVAVSKVVKRDILRYFPHTNPIYTVTPGVDPSAFTPARTAAGANADESHRPEGRQRELKVLFVGSEFRRKGLDLLLKALPENAQLIVVGKGERLTHYGRLVSTAGLKGRVFFEGLVPNIGHYYASADVLVLPSLREAFGMAALEAMAAGLPVIVSAATGVADLIDHGHNGLVFHGALELKSMLMRLCDPQLRNQLGANARHTAMAHTWDRSADAYESIYRDTLEKKRRMQA